MSGRPRKEVIREDEVGVYHVYCRCVRRAWLCGQDPVTGKNFDYRKAWIRELLRELVQSFAIDACVFAILSNHYHLLLRNRPDLAALWSDEEVVRRWWQACPERRNEDGSPAEPTDVEIQSLLSDPARVAEWRARLSSISWLMKLLNESIAKRANGEEGIRGHFWQERFGCRSLLDEGAILAASVYIDLNEIRAQLADTPETSRNTSAYYRILARIKRQLRAAGHSDLARDLDAAPPSEANDGQVVDEGADEVAEVDQWLCPIDERDCAVLLGPAQAETVIRSRELLAAEDESEPSPTQSKRSGAAIKQWRHGFLPMQLDAYLEFLDWNARQLVPGKKGAMDDRLPPILVRLGWAPSFWLRLLENFDRWFSRAVGSFERLSQEAARTGNSWRRGIGPMRGALG